jgi:hypothetical protein
MNDGDNKYRDRRKETFVIAADEQLIGCELSYCKSFF